MDYGTATMLHGNGSYWILIISAVILLTTHIQKMKDIAGNKLRDDKRSLWYWVIRWADGV